MVEIKQDTVLDSVVLTKNIDRLLKISDDLYIAATYHLDKESGLKYGSLTTFRVDEKQR